MTSEEIIARMDSELCKLREENEVYYQALFGLSGPNGACENARGACRGGLMAQRVAREACKATGAPHR